MFIEKLQFVRRQIKVCIEKIKNFRKKINEKMAKLLPAGFYRKVSGRVRCTSYLHSYESVCIHTHCLCVYMHISVRVSESVYGGPGPLPYFQIN